MDERLARITKKKRRLDSLRPFPQALATNLDDWFKIELTYTSNAIEGNTLTRQETALVVEDGITVAGKTMREHLEAVNHAEAWEYVKTLVTKTRQELTEQDLLAIHRTILKGIDPSNAGGYRAVAVRLSGSEAILPNPAKVPTLMADFMEWLTEDNPDHPAKIAGDAHYRLVKIHPFVDGNGRTARLLMELLLMQAVYPPAIISNTQRSQYIRSLETAHTTGSLNDYYALIFEAVEHSLDIYLQALEASVEGEPTVVEEQRFYTVEEVAMLLKVDPETVRRYVRQGKLRAMKPGGRFIRIEHSDLESFIANSKAA